MTTFSPAWLTFTESRLDTATGIMPFAHRVARLVAFRRS
jgi:hypothetical protein